MLEAGADAGKSDAHDLADGTVSATPDAAAGAGSFTTDAGSDGREGDPFVNGCASETRRGELLPVDVVFLFDTSGSMADNTSAGVPKWDAVRQAVQSFVVDPRSDGLGIALHYFPTGPVGVPDSCSTSADCNGAGPCSTKACARGGTVQACDTEADCAVPGTDPPQTVPCLPLGECSFYGDLCLVGSPEFGCFYDTCTPVASGTCDGYDICANANYETPAVPLRSLPGAGYSLAASLAAKVPVGATPTWPALRGALKDAQSIAAANPTHTVAVVLVTDGFPTECSPGQGVTAIADLAAAASVATTNTPAVKTFVVGVFSSTQQTQARLDMDLIALGGGTKKAFVLGTTGDLSDEFLKALEGIRSSVTCEYRLPVPEAGTPDMGKVNVRRTAGDGANSVLPFVGSLANCAAGSGWYYDTPSAGSGSTPTKILLCPASCASLKAEATSSVDIVLGCTTAVK